MVGLARGADQAETLDGGFAIRGQREYRSVPLERRTRMSFLIRFYNSTIGMKVVMALTGFALYGFLFAHMAGNLQLYLGEEEFNRYPVLLHTSTELIWGMRLGLLGAMVGHVVSAVRLTMISQKARPIGYQKQAHSAANLASRTMTYSGTLILAFVIYHLLHLTTGDLHSDFKVQEGLHVNDVFHNVITAFSNPLIAAGYMLMQVFIGAHLYHAAVSMFRTLGLSGERQLGLATLASRAVVGAIVLGNLSFPLAVLTGLVHK